LSSAFVPSQDARELTEADGAGPVNGLEFPGVADGRAPAAFELYVDDDRYSVPTLHLITAPDAETALAAAEARLADSIHYRGVELWQSGRRLLALGAPRRHGD
jgi:hypothetical protein